MTGNPIGTDNASQRVFQSYEDVSDPSAGPKRLSALRSAMKAAGLQGLLVPRTDEHQSEYLPAYAERVAWLTGFTGSNAFVLVLENDARVFTDGRYTLQVRQQTDASAFTTDDMVENPLPDYIGTLSLDGKIIGYDPWLHTFAGFRTLEEGFKKAGAVLQATPTNLIDGLWDDKPPRPREPITVHAIEYAGQPFQEKLWAVAATLSAKGADYAVLTQADTAAWLFNLRGNDVPQKPMFLAFAIVDASGQATLFVDPGKITDEAGIHLRDVTIRDIAQFEAALHDIAHQGKCVLIDPKRASIKIAETISQAGGVLVEAEDPVEAPRARKNAVEQEGARRAQKRDGIAVTKFLAWFEREAPKGHLDEIVAAEKLLDFRLESGDLKDIAFPTISGAGANGAIVHYRVTRSSNAAIHPDMLYLVDSGAQYFDGTTDITRTLLVGSPTPEQRRAYTRVLQGHIALAQAKFPKGTTGAHLDALARQYLWAEGLEYAHGTGHGVGSYLGVHEGLARIAKQGTKPLEPGMLLSNEPGYYKEGAFGIRLENLVLVTEPQNIGGDTEMLGFETITRAPFEPRLIDAALLSHVERGWLNRFHEKVLGDIGPHLANHDLDFLHRQCQPF